MAIGVGDRAWRTLDDSMVITMPGGARRLVSEVYVNGEKAYPDAAYRARMRGSRRGSFWEGHDAVDRLYRERMFSDSPNPELVYEKVKRYVAFFEISYDLMVESDKPLLVKGGSDRFTYVQIGYPDYNFDDSVTYREEDGITYKYTHEYSKCFIESQVGMRNGGGVVLYHPAASALRINTSAKTSIKGNVTGSCSYTFHDEKGTEALEAETFLFQSAYDRMMPVSTDVDVPSLADATNLTYGVSDPPLAGQEFCHLIAENVRMTSVVVTIGGEQYYVPCHIALYTAKPFGTRWVRVAEVRQPTAELLHG